MPLRAPQKAAGVRVNSALRPSLRWWQRRRPLWLRASTGPGVGGRTFAPQGRYLGHPPGRTADGSAAVNLSEVLDHRIDACLRTIERDLNRPLEPATPADSLN